MQNATNTNKLTKTSSRLILATLLALLLGASNNSAHCENIHIKTIAITEIVAHPSLEQAKSGIIDELKEQGYEVNKNLKIIEENAQGSIANTVLIAKKFVSLKPDVIIPISTPSAQAALKVGKRSSIPIVFSSVSDPIAAGLVKSLDEPNSAIIGASDFAAISEELRLIEAIVPNIKTIGVIYSAGEANSIKTLELLKEKLNGKWKVIESAVPNSNMVAEAMRALVGKVDAVYLPSDNTVFSAMAKVVQIAKENRLPLFSSDPDSVAQGVLACYGYTQYLVGRTAGNLVAKLLRGEKIEDLRITNPKQSVIVINKSTADLLGIATPTQLLGKNIKLI